MTLQIKTADVFRPLLQPSRYKGAYGGRGSGKSHFFAELLVEECLLQSGTLAVCVRETQKSLQQSSKRTVEAKIEALGVGSQFQVLHDRIVTPGNGLIIFQGMSDHTAESVKSLEGFRIAWIEEAQTLSERSLSLLRPTIRTKGSEIWASWNPTRKKDAIDVFLRQNKPDNAIVVESNWRHMKDAGFWSPELEAERLLDASTYPERYEHVWEGAYATAFAGAYYAPLLAAAEREGRYTRLTADPILPLMAFWDIGGSGANADATSIWIVQFVNQRIHVLDYIEGSAQVLGYYLDELRRRGYSRAICHLPHDGIVSSNITGKRYIDHIRDGGFATHPPLPNQGKGAATMRIEAVRRILPKCWFDADKTEAGRFALGFYHERKDENRDMGLGPEHDWSSHAADAFGLMAVQYEDPVKKAANLRKIVYPKVGVA